METYVPQSYEYSALVDLAQEQHEQANPKNMAQTFEQTYAKYAELHIQQNQAKWKACGTKDTEMMTKVMAYMQPMKTWYTRALGLENRLCIKSVSNKLPPTIVISKLHDMEENIWSPMLGLKGNVDGLVHVEPHGILIPVELKTGKQSQEYGSFEYRAQVITYMLMLMDRYAPSML